MDPLEQPNGIVQHRFRAQATEPLQLLAEVEEADPATGILPGLEDHRGQPGDGTLQLLEQHLIVEVALAHAGNVALDEQQPPSAVGLLEQRQHHGILIALLAIGTPTGQHSLPRLATGGGEVQRMVHVAMQRLDVQGGDTPAE